MELAIIQQKIHEIHGHKVMLDFDLADLYDVQTKVFKQAVKRNLKRFPSDFMFELTKQEFVNLRSQYVTSSWGGTRYLPFAFTEQGVAMLSSVLGSDKAIEMNIAIVRAFISLIRGRKRIAQNNLRPQSLRPQAFFQSYDQVLSCSCDGSTIQVIPVFHTICQNPNNCQSINY